MSPEPLVTIEPRFRGPPTTGNGGYVCGRLAAFIDGPARVRLHEPPPLGRAMRVEIGGERARLMDGDELVGTATPTRLDLEPPSPPPMERASEGRRNYRGYVGHPFPTCFVCGPERAPGDGLRIFAGPLDEKIVAAPFEPSPDLLDDDGNLRAEYVWAALDCPGYFAVVGDELPTMLLGELAVERRAPVPGGAPLLVYAWPLGLEERKASCGSALANANGDVLAVGRATWIRL